MKSVIAIICFFGILQASASIPRGSHGEVDFNTYKALYSIFPSSVIEPKVASALGIVIGNGYGVLNISVLDNTQTIKVSIKGTINNQIHQKPLNFIPVVEDGAVYYIANFKYDHLELLQFAVHVKPEFETYSRTLKFSHQLYLDGK